MLASQLRYYGQNMRYGVIAISNGNMLQIANGINRRNYSKDNKVDCCKNILQTEGKRVEPWPKPDPPPPAWRCECPRDPQPPNNDPYRIKIPDVVVPPLPPSNAKELPNEDSREMFSDPMICYGQAGEGHAKDLFHNSPIVHPDYWRNKTGNRVRAFNEVLPKLGYHGRTKYKFAFHEPWKPLDRLALLGQAEKEDLDPPEDAAKPDSEPYKL